MLNQSELWKLVIDEVYIYVLAAPFSFCQDLDFFLAFLFLYMGRERALFARLRTVFL